MVDEQRIHAITRPDAKLLMLYIIRSVLSGPFIILVLPLLFFRYHTMRYRIDKDGISMKWGILFRKEVNLTYARIQDIHVTSGFVQRWLGLADLHIQTASGSATAEMTIEGLLEFEEMRDYLYTRMRGFKDPAAKKVVAPVEHPAPAALMSGSDTELLAMLRGITEELRGAREAIEKVAAGSGRDHV